MARKLLASAPVLFAAVLHGEVSLAALHVAESPLCTVSLTKVSYDDPDTDDAEFLELRVEPREPTVDGPRAAPPVPRPHAPSDEGDAAASCGSEGGTADAGAQSIPEGGRPSARLTLADCGLSVLELVSGGGTECETYRSLPLGEASVPDDGILVLCASDSLLAGPGSCDVTTAGRSALKNGWIQNGPRDGIRFKRTDGTALELGYEGRLSCFSGSALSLADESGVTPNSTNEDDDDVGALCDDHYVILPSTKAPLREANECPRTPLPGDAGTSTRDAPSGDLPDGGSPPAPWTPEFAPPASGSSGTAPTASGPVYLDAGSFELSPRESSPPRPPSCAVALSTSASRFDMPLLGVLLAAAVGRRGLKRLRLRR